MQVGTQLQVGTQQQKEAPTLYVKELKAFLGPGAETPANKEQLLQLAWQKLQQLQQQQQQQQQQQGQHIMSADE
jgi:hypothetical protein